LSGTSNHCRLAPYPRAGRHSKTTPNGIVNRDAPHGQIGRRHFRVSGCPSKSPIYPSGDGAVRLDIPQYRKPIAGSGRRTEGPFPSRASVQHL
jgi:hypothetical protein